MPTWSSTTSPCTYPGRATPALAHLARRHPRTGVTVVDRPVGLRQVHAARRRSPGCCRPTAGRVTVGGRADRRRRVAAQVAWLPQRPLFVAGTRRRQPAPRPARRDRRRSCGRRCAGSPSRSACATSPAASTRRVGEDGATLSAGERARLALARVVLADRPWVLLDEPTAHLDELTEQVIADTIVELARTGAVVVVAHRPALVRARRPRSTCRLETRTGGAVAPPSGVGPTAASPRRSADGTRTSGAATRRAGPPTFWPQHRARRARLRLRRRPHRHRRLADRAGLDPAGRADPAGGDRGGPHLRPGPAGAALRRAAAAPTTPRCGCSPAAASRSTTRWCRSCPARLGRRRGDVLASVVDDVDSVRRPRAAGADAGPLVLGPGLRARGAVAAVLLPVAGLVVAGRCAAAARWSPTPRAVGRHPRRAGDRRAPRPAVRGVVETLQCRNELVMWQRTDAAVAARSPVTSEQLGAAVRRAGRWAAGARAWLILAIGAAVAVVGVTGRRRGPERPAQRPDGRPAGAAAAGPARRRPAGRGRRCALGPTAGRGGPSGVPGRTRRPPS